MLFFQCYKLIGKIKKKFPMKIRDMHKIENENFLVMGIKNDFQYMFQKILLKDMSIYS